jgi:hypothetical protein
MELTQDEGRVYGARYYTVQPVPSWDLYHTQAGVDKWNDMVAWCVETYGPSAKDGVWTPGMRWYVNNAKFWFRDKDDLMYFILRWS